MRWIILTFFLGTLGLFGSDPSSAALQFMTRLGASDGAAEADWSKELRKQLAISPFCGPAKKELIDSRWQERALWFQDDDFSFSVVGEKRDDNLAAVLIGARSDTGPDAVLVIALGAVKKEEQWMMTPLEGSFDNSGLGFSPAMRERVKALEEWMTLEKVTAGARLRAEEAERFRKSMEGVVDPEKLKLEDAAKVLEEFLKAAHAGETEQLLVWQGILERDQLPERDWERAINATRRGMKMVKGKLGRDSRSAWRVFNSNKVMRVIVDGHADTEDGSYLASFLSDFSTGPRDEMLNAVRFQMIMTDAGWRVKLPAFFAYDGEDSRVYRAAFNEEFDWEDLNRAEDMGSVFEKENEPIRTQEPEEMLEGVVADIREGKLPHFLRRFYREEEQLDKGEEEEDDAQIEEGVRPRLDPERINERRMERYRAALSWWTLVLGREDQRQVSLQKVHREGDLALGLLKVGVDDTGWKPKHLKIWLAKDESGWMLLPGQSRPLSHSLAPSLADARKKLSKVNDAYLLELQGQLLAGVLGKFAIDDPAGLAVDEAGGRKIIEAWHGVATNGDILDLVAQSAVRALPNDAEVFMRNIAYLRASAAASAEPDRVLGSMAVGRFRAFSMMVNVGPDVEPHFPLSFVVPTAGGHRLLVDLELPFETNNKGLKILNDERIAALKEDLPAEDLAAIISLREWHQKIARPAWEAWSLAQAKKEK